MAKKIDITEKLDFESNPILIIKGNEYEVNADAETVLIIMGILGEGGKETVDSILKVYELIFSEEHRNEINELKLQFSDFQKVITEAINLVIGEETQGE